ncbi:MAG: protein-L-isoaspartate(D-aspartate) O-methyltransferase [Desulfobacteraceae bacterium]
MPFIHRFILFSGQHIFLFTVFLYCTMIFTGACAQEPYEAQRNRMVKEQVIARGINDARVIRAMQRIERHLFVPAEYIQMAYRDGPLPIGYGQTISQPYIVAFMTDILKLKSDDRVLEIGTGSGYQAAVLAEICNSVFSIEVVPQLRERASSLLKKLGYDNILIKTGDGYKGWKEHAPFDAIIVTCSPTHIPKPLEEQLSEGGRMIIPVGERYIQQMVYLIKKDGKLHQEKVLPVSFVPMVDEKGKVY